MSEQPTEPTEEITEEILEEHPPTEAEKTVKSRKIRSQKQLEALERAREKAFAKRKEKAELKKKTEVKQEVNKEIHDEVKEEAVIEEPVKVEDAKPQSEDSIEEKMESRETREKLKRTMTLDEDQFINLMRTVAIQNKPVKSKYKMINGVYVLR